MVEIPPELRDDCPAIDAVTPTALVTGMGQSLMDDFVRARNKVMKNEDHPAIIGVNRSCQFIKTHINLTLDRDNASYWRSVAIHPEGQWYSVQPDATKTHEDYPWIDGWWPKLAGSGSSAWFAAKAALIMGYERVILCGVPLEPGPYADGIYAPTFQDAKKFPSTIRTMREKMQLDEWTHEAVFSMSGWTKAFFGGPT
jgi:hypothetical protein